MRAALANTNAAVGNSSRKTAQLKPVPQRSLLCLASAATQARPSSVSNHYLLLGVSHGASVNEIKAAFRSRARSLHPDVNKAPSATQQFMQLRNAYVTLMNPSLRSEYDKQVGTSGGRATGDPRFARFERWQREVLPELTYQLDSWTKEIDSLILEWDLSMRRSVTPLNAAMDRLEFACTRLASAHQPTHSPSLQQAHAALHAQPARVWPPPAGGHGGQFGPVGHGLHGAAAMSTPGMEGALRAEVVRASEEAQNALQVLSIALGDVDAVVRRQYDKRYEQVSQRFPGYPNLVWEDTFAHASDAWLSSSSKATDRWRALLNDRAARLQALRVKAGIRRG